MSNPSVEARSRKPRRRFVSVASMLLVTAAVATATATASAPPPLESADPAVVFYEVRSEGVAPTDLAQDLIVAGFQVSGRAGDGLVVMGTAATREALDEVDGLTIVSTERIDPVVAAGPGGGGQDDILPDRLDGRTYETFYGGYRTMEAFLQFEDDLAEAYPELVQVVEYGASYSEETPLRAVCITADAGDGCQLDPDVDKARFLLVTQIHARELTTSEISWRMMTHLLDAYQHRARVRSLLDSTEIWIAPQLNPDGVELVQEGIEEDGLGYESRAWQRKNTKPGDVECSGQWAFSHRGVDLNRNYDSHWGGEGTDPDQCGQTWPGEEPASEPETYQLTDLMQQLFRDQRDGGADDPAPLDTTGAMLSLHTAANLVLFPWGYDADVQAPNDAGLRSFAFRASYYNGYETGQAGEVLYNASGTTDDWAYDDLGIAAGTWELGPGSGSCAGFHPDYSCQEDFWLLNRPALKYQMGAARAPYMYSLGPTVLKARARSVGSGSEAEVVARVSDAALGDFGPNPPDSQNVTAARIYLGTPPWEGGTPIDMELSGSGGDRMATVRVDSGAKRQMAYVEGQDADGNWGPVRVLWIPAQR